MSAGTARGACRAASTAPWRSPWNHDTRDRRRRYRPRAASSSGQPTTAEPPPRQQLPDLRDPRFSLERETLKLFIQHPGAIGNAARDIAGNDFTHPTYRAVSQAMHERIEAVHPAVAGAMSHVDSSQEPRLERILSEIRTQRKRAQAAQTAGAEAPPGLNPLG